LSKFVSAYGSFSSPYEDLPIFISLPLKINVLQDLVSGSVLTGDAAPVEAGAAAAAAETEGSADVGLANFLTPTAPPFLPVVLVC
jgi:hypothetical protein